MIKFNEPYRTDVSLRHIGQLATEGKLSGDGIFAEYCTSTLSQCLGGSEVLLTPSGTAALELMMLASGLRPGDEVIVPSYTFSSTVNAICLFGYIPVFADVEAGTFNMAPTSIVDSITERTRAIMTVNYGGSSPNYTNVMEICHKHGLLLLEDAAQSIGASFNAQPLGTFGAMSCLSFHETKNIQCGEGGALIINDPSFSDLVKTIREKGTNRHEFLSGKIDKYTWRTLGSSYLMNEITAAYLYGQLQELDHIKNIRLQNAANILFMLRKYRPHNATIPTFVDTDGYNGHIVGLKFEQAAEMRTFMSKMNKSGVQCTSHYTALHLAKPGKLYGRQYSPLPHTETIVDTFVRLPVHSKAMDLDLMGRSIMNAGS
jgi:dTDP-4-amino-4,6-dideoxygalactose transaminase